MEIEAKDLRMGNYILDDEDTIVKVECLKSKEYNDWNGAEEDNILFSKSGELCWSSDTFGIPIAPEILEKAGFEFDDVMYYKGRLMLSKRKDGDWAVWYGNLTHGRLDECNITYLHQLQNLYFALTGQELNIEL